MLSRDCKNNDFLKRFKNLNITATKHIDEFVANDNENIHMFQEEILDEANLFWRNEDKNITSDEDESNGVGIICQTLQARKLLTMFTQSLSF